MPKNAEEIVVPTFTVSFWQVLSIIVGVGLLGLAFFWWDRHQAQKRGKARRVPEIWLMTLGLFGGATMMTLYMKVTGHKRRYPKFSIGLPIMALVHWALVVLTYVYDHPHEAFEFEVTHLVAVYVLVNLLGMILTHIDKRRAQRGMWRISEDTLLTVAALGGALSMFFMMLMVHHKTHRLKFMLGLPLLVVAQVAFILWVISDACPFFMVWLP